MCRGLNISLGLLTLDDVPKIQKIKFMIYVIL